ncbi:MAG TPA: hypothetical protein VIH59_26095 [Candidatus Tectomicrobia bacterium]
MLPETVRERLALVRGQVPVPIAHALVESSSPVQVFDDASNRALVRRVVRALHAGGYLVILEAIRPQTPGADGQVAGLLDLYFACTSRAGTRSLDELASWQRDAGLILQPPLRTTGSL